MVGIKCKMQNEWCYPIHGLMVQQQLAISLYYYTKLKITHQENAEFELCIGFRLKFLAKQKKIDTGSVQNLQTD